MALSILSSSRSIISTCALLSRAGESTGGEYVDDICLEEPRSGGVGILFHVKSLFSERRCLSRGGSAKRLVGRGIQL